MRMPSRRAMTHAAGALALAVTAVVTVGSPSRATGTLKPAIFSGKSTGSSIHFFFDRTPGVFPITDIFHVEVPYATSVITSSGDISATSATVFPGGGAVSGPALLCGQFVPCGFNPPAYPAIASSNYPNNPDAAAETSLDAANVGGILHFEPSVAKAHSDPDNVDAHTTAATATVLDLLKADSVSTRSHQYFKNGALITEAASDVTGIDVLGGALHIDSISSLASSVVGGGTKPSVSLHTTVSGATLAGMPISIDEAGVHLATQGDGGALASNFNKALAQLEAGGVSIRLTSPSKALTKDSATASTSGLFIGFARTLPDAPLPLPPLPLPIAPPGTGGDYVGSISIAGAGVSAFASGQTVLDNTPGHETSVPGTTPATTGGSDPSLGEPAAVGPVAVASLPGAIATTPVVVPGRSVAIAARDTTASKLKILALALLAYPALVLLFRIVSALLGGALGAPPRLPRAQA